MNAKEVIEALAAQLRVPVSHLWSVLTRQAYIEAAEWVVFSVVVGIALRFAWMALKKYEGCEDDLVWGAFWIIGGILTLFATLGTIDAIGMMFNPEYYALKQVLDAIKGK